MSSKNQKGNRYIDPKELHPGPCSSSFYPAHSKAYSQTEAQTSLITPSEPGCGSWIPMTLLRPEVENETPWGT